jgi:hypothetical protein
MVLAAAMLASAADLVAPLPATAVGTPPTADSQGVTTPQVTDLPIVLGAHDPEGGGSLTFDATTPANGLITPTSGSMSCVDNAGVSDCTADVTYTPNTGFHGADSFTFIATDPEAETSSAATVTIEVNSPPVAFDDPGALCQSPSQFGGSYPIPEDFPDFFLGFASCALIANDTDADGDALAISVITPPSHGWYEEVNAGGIDLAYKPDPDYSTIAGDQPGGDWISDSVTYVATDGVAASNEATIRFWIAPINDPPSFAPGALVIEVDEDSGAYSAQWVVPGSIEPGPSNESGQSVRFEVVDLDVVDLDLTGVPNLFAVDPAIDSNGVLTFTTGADQYGLAFVTVQAVDDGGLEDWGLTYPGLPGPDDTSDPFQFAIVVDSVNDAPVAMADSVTTDEDTPLEFDLVATDDNGGTVGVLPDDPSHGTLEALGSAGVSCAGTICTRTVIYTPDSGYAGPDSFTFLADDGGLQSDPATVTITVGGVNDPPSFTAGTDPAVDEDGGAYSGSWASGISTGPVDEAGQTVSFQITANDNAALFAIAPAVTADGMLTFTPAGNRHGVAHLAVVAVDDGGTANGGQDTSGASTLTITVAAVNDPPNAVDDADFFMPQGSSGIALQVLGNDTSLPDDPETLLIVAVTQGAHGTVLITDGGTTVTYVPAPTFHGLDMFSYTIEDPGGLSDNATVVVDVGKDVAAPTVVAPHQAIRKLVRLGTSTLKARMTWSGSDAGVGIDHFVLQRSTNGGSYKAVTLSSPTSAGVNVTLTIGSSYRFRVRAVDRNGNASAWAYGPTFKVSRYQETSNRITYGGRWVRAYGARHSGGYVKYASVAGRSATFTRTLRDVAFVAPISSGRGTADIYLDGVKVASISLKSSTTRYRRVLWTAHFDALTTHVVRVVVTGSRRVDVDCFVVLR